MTSIKYSKYVGSQNVYHKHKDVNEILQATNKWLEEHDNTKSNKKKNKSRRKAR